MATVFIVDDSLQVRTQLSAALQASGVVEVVGATADPFLAWEQMIRQPVDVLLLDTALSQFNSLTFFRYLLDSCPLPTVLLSPASGMGSQMAIEALRYGAVAAWVKQIQPDGSLGAIEELVAQIVSSARLERNRLNDQNEARWVTHIPGPGAEAEHAPPVDGCVDLPAQSLIAVGGSTGAVAAMQTLFGAFSLECPPAVAVIHLPEGFTKTYAQQLDDHCLVTVKEAEDGEVPRNGHVYLAPGNRHLVVERRRAGGWLLRIIGGPKVFYQRPAADVLFHSVADAAGAHAVGVLLTGMGKDGAEGLLRMRQAGAFTITQDEASCAVYGMPKEAVAIGASCVALPLDRIAAEIRCHVC